VQYVATREGDAPGEVTAAARTSHTTSDQGHFQVHAPEAAAGPSTPPLGTDANIPTPPAEDAAARSSSNKGKKD
jgi:hypothetical protein